MRLNRPVLVVALILAFTAACASSGGSGQSAGRGTPCRAPAVDSVYLRYGPVYRECDVDERAVPRTRPQLDLAVSRSPGDTQGPACVSAEIEFVVDETGRPRPDPIRTVKATSSDLLARLRSAVPEMRYKPAVKDGQPVAQLVRFGIASRRVVTVNGQRPSAPSRAPNC